MSTVEIIGHPASTFVRTVRMACHEKGVSYDITVAPPHTGQLLSINPYGKMPAFRHGEVELFESLAILVYIDEAFDGPSLLPVDKREKAKALQWVGAILDGVVTSVLRGYIGEYVFPQGPDGAPRHDVIATNLPKVRNHLRILDEILEGNTYLSGEAPGLADLYLAPILFYLEQMPEGPEMLGNTVNVARYRERIEARDSFKETVPPPPPT